MDLLRNIPSRTSATLAPIVVMALALAALPGCLVTDHTEQEEGVTTTDMQIPASGYQDGDASRIPVISFDSTAIALRTVLGMSCSFKSRKIR